MEPELAPVPANELERLEALKRYEILDTSDESQFDDFTWLASQICNTPIALISLVDEGRQWFKSRIGIEVSETPREFAFCAHTILRKGILEVRDALKDIRFNNNPLVLGSPDIRFYAGMPLTTEDGFNLGSMCVIDRVPRHLSDDQKKALAVLGRQVVSQLELRLSKRKLQQQVVLQEQVQRDLTQASTEVERSRNLEQLRLNSENKQRYDFLADTIPQIVWTTKADGRVDYFNQRWFDYTGLSIEQTRDWGWTPVLHPEDLAHCIECWNKSLKTGCLYEVEYRFKRFDGIYRWYMGRAHPYRNSQGQIVQWVGTCTDIDDQKRERAQLENRVRERTAELAGARERLESVLDAATRVSIIATDVDGLITVFNRGSEHMLGYTAAEMVGKQTPAVFHLESEIVKRGKELSLELGREVQGFDIFAVKPRDDQHEEREWTYVRKDGTTLTVNLVGTASRDANGTLTGFLGVATDITARKKADKTLRDQALILDLANDTIFLRDIEDRITYWNQGAERLYGWSSAEARGKITHELLKTQFPSALEEIAKVLHASGFWEGELIHTKRDGQLVTVASSWTLNRDETGRPISVIEMNYDITARKKAERELEKSRELLSTILRSSIDGVIAFESVRDDNGFLKDFRYILLNPAAEKFIRMKASDLVGQNLREKFPNVFRDGLFDKFTEIVESGVALDFEYFSDRTDPPRWYRMAGVKLGDGLVISYTEITARKQYEHELQEARKRAESADNAKSEFLANMSHEIRTPMNGVLGMTGLLLDTNLEPKQKHLAETIRGSAESLLGLLNDILDFSKIEAGKLSFEEIDFDLRRVVEDTMEVLASQAEVKSIDLVGGVSPETTTKLRGDPGRTRQILTNLIGNAIKFTGSGQVGVSVKAESETDTEVLIRFEIKDTGVGVPRETQERLFQPFIQEDSSTSRKFGGTGLGLAICKRLAESMHGSIGFDSIAGKGSTFWVTLRFSKQTELTGPVDHDELNDVRVLVVDANETSRRFTQSQLALWKMRNGGAATAEEAMAMLQGAVDEKSPFSIALIDQKLGFADGLELVQKVNGDPRLVETRIILVTPFGKTVSPSELRTAYISAWYTKPLRQSALLDCLVQVISNPAGSADRKIEQSVSYVQKAGLVEKKEHSVLIAEDNVVNQQVALGNLHRLGYDADIAANGFEVLHALENKEYDVIFMDCHMPQLDGYETTKEIRRREQTGHCAWIIAMTANVMVGDKERCLAAGMNDYVGKPIRRAELEAVLERIPAPSTREIDIKYLRKLETEGRDDLLEIIDIFIASAPATMRELSRAFKYADIDAIEMAAHTLKGACANFGKSHAHDVCVQIEQRAKTGILGINAKLVLSAERGLAWLIEGLELFRKQKPTHDNSRSRRRTRGGEDSATSTRNFRP